MRKQGLCAQNLTTFLDFKLISNHNNSFTIYAAFYRESHAAYIIIEILSSKGDTYHNMNRSILCYISPVFSCWATIIIITVLTEKLP